ncbi:MAG TPA: sigma-70 family RNA polymerase sigma factor [Proteiniphilum sp.]|nr:sigma-70 family RNA polymerase sigma factor [Proteiniphilum sp.]HPJ49177.1 sigma-70 family RNA polymerase sigma factor [Proteiniphilum sp.]HPR19163.1 sigma-70 family RNA polymerase sigma factor [Proteiniphilum sp.]
MDILSTMTDEELVVLYAGGNDDAFDLLLERHQQVVFSYILYTVRNKNLADDFFQETFCKAIVTIRQGRYTESGRFRSWLMRIAHNLMIDYFRQKKNEKTLSNDEWGIDLLNNPSLCEENVEGEWVRRQVRSDVKKLVQHLPHTQREVVEMRYYGELSFKEIADITGVSINTALGRMRYAILNMRRLAADHQMILTLS